MSRDPAHAASYADSIPDLWARLPESLRNAGSVRAPFAQAQENQVKEAETSGSSMVKRQKHTPILRPTNHHAVTARAFHQAWAQEQEAALMRQAHAEVETKRNSSEVQGYLCPQGR